MEHTFFFDGNSKGIAWVIQTNDSLVEQKRENADIFLNKVTIHHSKYIAMHVGLFWEIGKFIIKNEDNLTIKIDNNTMFDQLSGNENSLDNFIKTRAQFISHLIDERKLKINYELVLSENNIASKLI